MSLNWFYIKFTFLQIYFYSAYTVKRWFSSKIGNSNGCSTGWVFCINANFGLSIENFSCYPFFHMLFLDNLNYTIDGSSLLVTTASRWWMDVGLKKLSQESIHKLSYDQTPETIVVHSSNRLQLLCHFINPCMYILLNILRYCKIVT